MVENSLICGTKEVGPSPREGREGAEKSAKRAVREEASSWQGMGSPHQEASRNEAGPGPPSCNPHSLSSQATKGTEARVLVAGSFEDPTLRTLTTTGLPPMPGEIALGQAGEGMDLRNGGGWPVSTMDRTPGRLSQPCPALWGQAQSSGRETEGSLHCRSSEAGRGAHRNHQV